ncbi:hypothetical protein D3C78_1656470 [compost metagenome]
MGYQAPVFDFAHGQVQRHDGVANASLDRALEDVDGVDLHGDLAHGQPVLCHCLFNQGAGAVAMGLAGKHQRPCQRLFQ